MNNHTEFILSPITGILKDVVSASTGIGSGIETYPLCDYIMQSVFLKMTGFQEQKMKCICWELATNDYRCDGLSCLLRRVAQRAHSRRREATGTSPRTLSASWRFR